MLPTRLSYEKLIETWRRGGNLRLVASTSGAVSSELRYQPKQMQRETPMGMLGYFANSNRQAQGHMPSFNHLAPRSGYALRTIRMRRRSNHGLAI